MTTFSKGSWGSFLLLITWEEALHITGPRWNVVSEIWGGGRSRKRVCPDSLYPDLSANAHAKAQWLLTCAPCTCDLSGAWLGPGGWGGPDRSVMIDRAGRQASPVPRVEDERAGPSGSSPIDRGEKAERAHPLRALVPYLPDEDHDRLPTA